MEIDKTHIKILKLLLKDFASVQTITSLAVELKLSRTGVWKVLKKLEKENLILLLPIGKGKTSTYSIYLNWTNILTEKTLSLALSEESVKQNRWISNFAELKNKINFLIIYGSILHSPKEANDIDIIIISDKKNFRKIDKTILKIQKTQIKKIHVLNFTSEEFKQELEKPNKSFIDAVKKGVILFGHDNFIKFIREIYKNGLRNKKLF